MISYAQNFEDVMLWRALGHIERGFYLDIGAQLPIYDSVSKAFYDAGWRGVHVEATPTYAAAIRADRPDEIVIQAAVSDEQGQMSFFEIPETGLSTGRAEIASSHAENGFATREIVVSCVSLSSILTSITAPQVHWMKIDVEGMEAQVLRSWRDCAVRPWVLVIESTFPASQSQTHGEWVDLVLSRGYREAYFDGLSRYFVAEGHDELMVAFDRPPNVFDGFQVQSHHFSVQSLIRDNAQNRQILQDKLAAVGEAKLQILAESDHLRALADKRLSMLTEHEKMLGNAVQEKSALEVRIGQIEQDQRAALTKLAEMRGALEQAERNHAEQIAIANGERDHARSDLSRRSAAFDQRSYQMRADIDAANQRLDLAHAAHRDQVDRLSRDYRAQAEKFAEERSSLLAELSTSQSDLAGTEQELARSQVLLSATREQLTQQQQHSTDRIQALEDIQAELNARLQGASDQLRQAETALNQIVGIRLQNLTRYVRRKLGLPAPPIDEIMSRWRSSESPSASSPFNEPSYESPVMTPSGNPYHRAESLAALCAWHDLDFVRCAYVTILGRQPDEAGEAHYVNKVRDGVHKLSIIRNLRRSEEGQRHDPGIAGLDKALRRHRNATRPVAGAVVRLLTGREGNSVVEMRLRMLANDVGSMRGEMRRGFAELAGRVDWNAERAVTMGSDADADQGPTSHEIVEGKTVHDPSRLTPRAKSIYARLTQ
jgi:FkbM family methyltransferase